MKRSTCEKLLRVVLACWIGAALASCTQATPPSTETAAPASSAQTASNEAADALPASILRALGTDAHVLDCAQGTRDGVSQFRPDWVQAQRLDLNGDGRRDWIVEGRHACLREGEIPYWWAYADEVAGPRLVLSSVAAQALQPAEARSGGFRDLRLKRDGGETIARYEGGQYALPAGAPTPVAAASETQADTVAGRLDIEALPRGAHGDESFRIALAGKELRRTGAGGAFPDYPAPRILERYPQGIAPFDEVIVFQQDMRGNACNGGPLWMLGLKRDGSHAISDPIDFCGGKAPQLSATREQLTVVLPGGPLNRGEGEVPTETWRYRNGEVVRVPAP